MSQRPGIMRPSPDAHKAEPRMHPCSAWVADIDAQQHMIVARCLEAPQCLKHERRSDAPLAPLRPDAYSGNPPVSADNSANWQVFTMGQQGHLGAKIVLVRPQPGHPFPQVLVWEERELPVGCLKDGIELAGQRRRPRREPDTTWERNSREGGLQIAPHHICCRLLRKPVPLEKPLPRFGERLGGDLQNMRSIGGADGQEPACLCDAPLEQEGAIPTPAVGGLNLRQVD
jgi:hypothetical protein